MSKRKEFINRVIEKTDLPKKDVEVYMEAVFEAVEDTLLEAGEVSIGKLGKLKVVQRAARKGRNPQTGEEIQIEAKNAAKYEPSKHMKEKLNS